MSTLLTPVITQDGLQAVFNATNDGLQARITHIALGDAGWVPDATVSALRSERRRIPVGQGERLTPTQIHITAVEDGNQIEYWVREVGFILDDGTLLAVWSNPDQALAFKAANVDLLLAFDMVMTALPADSVVVDGTGGVNLAPATASKQGVVRFATPEEARAGTATDLAMTPAGSRTHGDARYARTSHRHNWNQIDAKPSVYPPASHNHDKRYIQLTSQTRVTYGRVGTVARRSRVGWWNGYDDTRYNYVDIYPPGGYTMSHLIGFIGSIGAVHYAGDVDGNDSIWLKWHNLGNRIRVVCNNTENRAASQINYLAMWRK